MKLNGHPMPPGFDRFESFGYDELTAKRCYFKCSRPPPVDGIKNFKTGLRILQAGVCLVS